MVVTEKLKALVQVRMSNTRMRDYFDLWLLTVIRRPFANRGMEIDAAPIPNTCLQPFQYRDQLRQRRRIEPEAVPLLLCSCEMNETEVAVV
jgi:hypothetical protein